jgi:hypothetical protein
LARAGVARDGASGGIPALAAVIGVLPIAADSVLMEIAGSLHWLPVASIPPSVPPEHVWAFAATDTNSEIVQSARNIMEFLLVVECDAWL